MRATLSTALQEQTLVIMWPEATIHTEVLTRDEVRVSERDGDHVYERDV
jgi:hypothetical protein